MDDVGKQKDHITKQAVPAGRWVVPGGRWVVPGGQWVVPGGQWGGTWRPVGGAYRQVSPTLFYLLKGSEQREPKRVQVSALLLFSVIISSPGSFVFSLAF